MGIDADVKQGQGRFACLLAQDLDAADVSSFSEPVFGAFPGANVPPFFKFLLAKHLQVMHRSKIPIFFLCRSYLSDTHCVQLVHVRRCSVAERFKHISLT